MMLKRKKIIWNSKSVEYKTLRYDEIDTAIRLLQELEYTELSRLKRHRWRKVREQLEQIKELELY